MVSKHVEIVVIPAGLLEPCCRRHKTRTCRSPTVESSEHLQPVQWRLLKEDGQRAGEEGESCDSMVGKGISSAK